MVRAWLLLGCSLAVGCATPVSRRTTLERELQALVDTVPGRVGIAAVSARLYDYFTTRR